MSSITLRIRGPSGASSLQLSPEASLAELKLKIEEITSIKIAQQELRLGFPPKPLVGAKDATLSSLGLKSGEPVIVAEVEAASEPAPIPVVPQKRSSPPAIAEATRPAPSRPPPTATRPPPPPAARSTGPKTPPSVAVEGGHLVLRVVPDDNSCLFTAVGLVLEPGKPDIASTLRKQVAEVIRSQPEEYSDVVLGRPRDEYISTILKPNSWGGAIELSIFAKQYSTEIVSIDVQTGRMDRFGQGSGFETIVLLLYSGIHYDAFTFTYLDVVPSLTFPPPNLEFDQTSFPADPVLSESMLEAASKLVEQLRKEHQYTDAATFTLRCEQCRKALVGEKEASKHAMETGHTDFGEYDGSG